MAEDQVTLDFSRAKPIPNAQQPTVQQPVVLDFSRAQAIPVQPPPSPAQNPVVLDFTKAQPIDLDQYRFTTWDHIRSAVGKLIPESATPALVTAQKYGVEPFEKMAGKGAEFGRDVGEQVVTGYTLLRHPGDWLSATMGTPYGPMPPVRITPEQQAHQEHPLAMGAAQAVGEVAGGFVADPRNWPLMAMSQARPVLQRIISGGFAAQMGTGTVQSARYLSQNWDRMTPEQRAEYATKTGLSGLMTLGAGAHAVFGDATPKGKGIQVTSQRELPVVTSPVGSLLNETVPVVRIADSSAAAHAATEADTVLRPVTPAPAVASEAPRSDARVADARVAAPSGVAELRNPSARVVTEDHVPVISRDAVLNQAVQIIANNSAELKRIGLDPSKITKISDIDAALQIASDHIRPNLDPRAYGPITFEGQKALAADLGMGIEDLLSRKRGETFNAEQLVAARAMLMASQQRVLGLARAAADLGTPETLNEFTIALAQHQAIQEVVAGVRAEAGRSLGSLRIKEGTLPGAKITSLLDKLPDDVRAEAAREMSRFDPTDPQTVRRVNQFVEKIRPTTTLEKLNEYYRNALLSSPHTIVVKTASEAAMATMETMKKVVAGGIAKLKDSPDRFASEAWWYAKGMFQALAEHARSILGGDFQLEGSPGFERAGTQAIKGKLGQVVRAPSELMSRLTNLIYAGNYFGEINAQAARQAILEGLDGDAFHGRQEYLAHHPTPDMQEAAHDLATTNTFQNELGKFGKKIESVISHKPELEGLLEGRVKTAVTSTAPGRFLFPFFRTPINLLKASLTHATPYELLTGIAKGDVDSMARGVLGSSIAAALAYGAISGHITGGGPTDYRKSETQRATGFQPYSVKIGNRYISYRRFEPVGLVAGLVADAVHGIMHGDPEVVGMANVSSAVKQIMRNLDDLPFLGTLSNLLQSIHDPTSGLALGTINRMAGSLIPAGMANIAMTYDPTVRRPRNPLQAVEARIPGLTGAASPIVNIRGEQVTRPTSQLGGANPFEWQSDRGDPVTKELARLEVSTPQAPRQIKFRGKQSELTESEKTQLMQEENKHFYERMQRLISSPYWNQRTDEQKKKAIASVHKEITEARIPRLARMRRQTQADLAARSLHELGSAP